MKLKEKGNISFAITGIEWPVYNNYYLVEANGKQLIQGFTKSGFEKYNPLYRDGRLNLTLFRKFVEVPEKADDIFLFVKKYGLLWADEENKPRGKENSVSDIMKELRLFKKANMLYELLLRLKDNPDDQEVIETFNNIIEYRDIETLYSSKKIKVVYKENLKEPYWKNPEPGLVRVKSKELDKERDIVVIKPELKNDLKVISKHNLNGTARHKRAISSYLTFTVMNKLEEGISLSYHGIPAREDESLNFSVYPSLECRDLASAMWLQFYLVLQGKIRLKPCKNENCNRFIEEGKKEYCSPSCKKAKNQRGRRKRRKEEEEHQKNKVENK